MENFVLLEELMRAFLKNCCNPQVPGDMHIEFLPLPSHLPAALLSYLFFFFPPPAKHRAGETTNPELCHCPEEDG